MDNHERAQRAKSALDVYAAACENNEQLDLLISDFVCDLFHLCDENKFNFMGEILDRAMEYYNEEKDNG